VDLAGKDGIVSEFSPGVFLQVTSISPFDNYIAWFGKEVHMCGWKHDSVFWTLVCVRILYTGVGHVKAAIK